MSTLQIAALLGSLASSVSAHGTVQGIVAGGKWYQGYNPSFQFDDPPPTVIGWSVPEDLSNGFIDPNNYTNPNIICHLGATPAGASAKVAAGSVVELQWTLWPSSHHGPVIDYLAKCPGSCTDVDKTTLEFFKIDQGGLVNDATVPGTWASDQLIANNNSWVVTIPKSIAPGNYVLRHEIIALHSAGSADGAQNYPQCINLQITGSGSDSPAGTLGTDLYKEDDPGILINIYTSLSTYKIPGPTLIAGAVSMKQTEIPFNGDGVISTPAGGASATVSAIPSITASSESSSVASASSAAGSFSAPGVSSSTAAPSSTAVGSAVPSFSAPVYSNSSVGAASGSASIPLANSTAPVSSGVVTTTYTTIVSVSATTSVSSVSAAASLSVPAPPLPSGSVPVYSTVVVVSSTTSVAPLPTSSSGKYPADKPIPKGFTFGDLLAWLKYTVRTAFNKGGKKHARDFSVK